MIERMFKTKKAPYPVERTLLVTGALDALMTSHAEGERRIETPHLAGIAVGIILCFIAFQSCLRFATRLFQMTALVLDAVPSPNGGADCASSTAAIECLDRCRA
jgi:hypothetical protein